MPQLLTHEEEAAEQARLDEAERLDWFEGAGRLMVTENDMRMRNIADQILNRMAQAVPDIYIRIVCKLQGIQ